MMDLDKRLRCLSLNPALKFTTMSSSSQTMGGTTNSTPISDSMLAIEEDEDEDVDGGVRAL